MAALGVARDDYKRALAAAIYQEGFALLAESVKECPVDKGRLRASGYVSPPVDAENPAATVGYGTDYAIYVHERTELRHPVGKAKFLSDPMNRRLSGYQQRIAARTQENYRSGVGVDAIPVEAPTTPGGG